MALLCSAQFISTKTRCGAARNVSGGAGWKARAQHPHMRRLLFKAGEACEHIPCKGVHAAAWSALYKIFKCRLYFQLLGRDAAQRRPCKTPSNMIIIAPACMPRAAPNGHPRINSSMSSVVNGCRSMQHMHLTNSSACTKACCLHAVVHWLHQSKPPVPVQTQVAVQQSKCKTRQTASSAL